jgi:hypothetical protein
MYDAPRMHTESAPPEKPRSVDPPIHTLDAAPPDTQDDAEDGDDEPLSTRSREGLPKTYRSRHDRHYVEQLTSANSMPLLRMLAVGRIDAANLPMPTDVAGLTASVARVGILQPLLVRAQGDRFVLIAGRKRLVAAQQAQLREVPCLVHTADEARANELADAANAAASERRERLTNGGTSVPSHAAWDSLSGAVLPEIQHAITTVQRSLRLLSPAPATTRERVAMRLMTAELERAQWLVRCRQYLAGRVSFSPRMTTGAELLKEFRSAAAGIALHGGVLEIAPVSADVSINVDVALLAAAVHGLQWALLALGETTGDPRVHVAIESSTPGTVVLALTQPTAVLTQQTLLRFFEAGWRARTGGAAAELAVQLARYAAARHRAEIEVSSGNIAGTSIALTFR